MTKQINALSNMGLLSRFIGMLTDSRSFLSYSRHEYFRRLLCNLIGQDVQRGYVPDDRDLLGALVRTCASSTRATTSASRSGARRTDHPRAVSFAWGQVYSRRFQHDLTPPWFCAVPDRARTDARRPDPTFRR